MKPERIMTRGPKTTSTREETTKISTNGANIEWMTAGIQRFNHGSSFEASQAAMMMGKIVEV